MNMSNVSRLAGIVILTAIVGCAARKNVVIESEPAGARIFLNGQDAGQSPIETELRFKHDKPYTVVAVLSGYEDATTTIDLEPKSQTDYQLTLAKKERTITKFVEIQPVSTEQGTQLKPVESDVVAYLDTLERSSTVPSVTQMTYNTSDTAWVGGPVASPNSDWFVYPILVAKSADQSAAPASSTYTANLWKQNVGSATKTRLTFGKGMDIDPAFTPDGAQVIFSSDRSGLNQTLWQVKIEGVGGLTKITNSEATDYSPSLSAGCESIAYASIPMRADGPQIWTVRRDGNLPTQLREGDEPQLSPDGQKIVFTRLAGETNTMRNKRLHQLWMMSADGSNETLLTADLNGDVINPRWSTDGQWILFACDEGKDATGASNFDIWMMSPDGSKRSQLTANGSRDDSPCMDRTQEHVYFRSNRGGHFNIWRFPTTFLGVKKIATTEATPH